MIDVLKDKNTRRISFTLGNAKVNSAEYKLVAAALKDKSIAVSYNKDLGSDEGRYHYKPRNKFIMGFNAVGANESRMALVVHEASHAVFDLNKTKLKVKESEAAAYIAQALYFYYAWGYDEEGEFEEPTFSTGILTASWAAAKSVAGGGSPSDDELSEIYKELDKHSHYHGRLDVDETFDG